MEGRQGHWQQVYAEKEPSEVSWFEPDAKSSLAMLDAVGAAPSMSLVDVGAGASGLAAALLRLGFTDITALDVAEEALAAARAGLGAAAGQVSWVVGDVLAWAPVRRFDIWHDRAVFHFLTGPDERRRYLEVVDAALAPGGLLVVGTFAHDGPERCSGLPTCRYSPAGLVAALTDSPHGGEFEVLTQRREEHHTPWGAIQPFTWVGLRRRDTL